MIVTRYGEAEIEGPDGRFRQMAFLGDGAFCWVCNIVGEIVGDAPVHQDGRMIGIGGQRQAVGGDIVICKCPNHPRIVATYGTSWEIVNEGYGDYRWAASAPEPVAPNVTYDEQFTLKDSDGRTLANIRYRIVTGKGRVVTATTNAIGETERIETDGTEILTLYTAGGFKNE